jgi:hypothetical protein
LNPEELHAEAASKKEARKAKEDAAKHKQRGKSSSDSNKEAQDNDGEDDDDDDDNPDRDDAASGSDEEVEDFERQRSISEWAKRGEVPSNRLPVKSTLEGFLLQPDEQYDSDGESEEHGNAQQDQSDVDESDEYDDDDGTEQQQVADAQAQAAADVPLTAAQQYQVIIRKKEKIAKLSSIVLEDPEENMPSLSELMQMAESSNPILAPVQAYRQVQIVVAQYALLSVVAIFKDIIPGYVCLTDQ